MKQLIVAMSVIAMFGCKAEQPEPVVEQTPAPAPAPATAPVTTTSAAVQTVDIRISGGEYQPASVTVAKGQPVRLNFTRDEKPTCGDVLVFPALNIRKEIPVNQVVSVDLNPTETGNLEFTCGMNMMKGAVVVQ